MTTVLKVGDIVQFTDNAVADMDFTDSKGTIMEIDMVDAQDPDTTIYWVETSNGLIDVSISAFVV